MTNKKQTKGKGVMTKYPKFIADNYEVYPDCPHAEQTDFDSLEVVCKKSPFSVIDYCSSIRQGGLCPLDKESVTK